MRSPFRLAWEVSLNRYPVPAVLAAACLMTLFTTPRSASAQLRFEVSVVDRLGSDPLDGRLLLLLSTSDEKEPRFLIAEGVKTQQVFGVDVDGMRAGKPVTLDRSAPGYPMESLGA